MWYYPDDQSKINVIILIFNWADTWDHWAFVLCPQSGILKNIAFGKLNLFTSWGKGVWDF
jgi:hypothetical protein